MRLRWFGCVTRTEACTEGDTGCQVRSHGVIKQVDLYLQDYRELKTENSHFCHYLVSLGALINKLILRKCFHWLVDTNLQMFVKPQTHLTASHVPRVCRFYLICCRGFAWKGSWGDSELRSWGTAAFPAWPCDGHRERQQGGWNGERNISNALYCVPSIWKTRQKHVDVTQEAHSALCRVCSAVFPPGGYRESNESERGRRRG